MTDLFHECKSDTGMGYVRPLNNCGIRTPYHPTISDMGIPQNPLKLNPIKYYENFTCDDCGLHVMRLKNND